ESRQHSRLLAMRYKVIRFKFYEVMSLFTFRQKLFSQAPELKQLCDRHLLLWAGRLPPRRLTERSTTESSVWNQSLLCQIELSADHSCGPPHHSRRITLARRPTGSPRVPSGPVRAGSGVAPTLNGLWVTTCRQRLRNRTGPFTSGTPMSTLRPTRSPGSNDWTITRSSSAPARMSTG